MTAREAEHPTKREIAPGQTMTHADLVAEIYQHSYDTVGVKAQEGAWFAPMDAPYTAAEVEADSRRDAAAKTTGFDEWYSLPSSLVVTAGAGAHTGPHVDENYAAEVAEEEAAKAQAAPGTSGAPQPVTGYGTSSARGNCDAHHHQEQRPLAESVKMLGPPPPLPPATQPPTKRPPPPPPPSALPLPPLPIPVAARLSAPPLRPSRAPQLRPSRAPPTLGRLSD